MFAPQLSLLQFFTKPEDIHAFIQTLLPGGQLVLFSEAMARQLAKETEALLGKN
jgi:hypothetical protein